MSCSARGSCSSEIFTRMTFVRILTLLQSYSAGAEPSASLPLGWQSWARAVARGKAATLLARWGQNWLRQACVLYRVLLRASTAPHMTGRWRALTVPLPLRWWEAASMSYIPSATELCGAAWLTRAVILSEAPLGALPEKWRFPARNRIIAGLSDVVVVVESHVAGGSLHTVDEAAKRDIPVLAVPGSVRNPAAEGTNMLLRDGCAPACTTADVLCALPVGASIAVGSHKDVRATSKALPDDQEVLNGVDWALTSTEDVLLRTGRPLGEVAVALTRLVRAGLVSGSEGWWQRVR